MSPADSPPPRARPPAKSSAAARGPSPAPRGPSTRGPSPSGDPHAAVVLPDPLPGVVLVTGAEDLLLERRVDAVVRAARRADPDTSVERTAPSALAPGAVGALTGASLFGERRVLVVDDVAVAGADLAAELKGALEDPADGVTLVLVARSLGRGKAVPALLSAARAAVGSVELTCPEVKTRRDRHGFVMGEFRAAGWGCSTDAAWALIDSVGGDLRSLAAACRQLVADLAPDPAAPDPGGPDSAGPNPQTGPNPQATDRPVATLADITRYYAGRAEVTGFEVADRAVEGRAAEAMAAARWAMATGTDPVLVVSALASTVRSLVRLSGAPRGVDPGTLARDLGVAPWKVDTLRTQLQGWSIPSLAAAVQVVADADAAVKGEAADAKYAAEHAVLQVALARRRS